MADVTIRLARPDELPSVGALTLAAYQADGYLEEVPEPGYADELSGAAARAEHADLLVAVDDDGTLLGTLTVVHPGSRFAELSRDDELEIRMLAVAPAARGRGIGAELTRAALRQAAEQGKRAVALYSVSTRTKVHTLYERLGFQRDPERDWQVEPDLLLLAFAAKIGQR